MKLRPSICALVLMFSLFPATAIAQDGLAWHITPWIGTAVSSGDIGEAVSNAGFTVEPGEINNAPAYGVFAGVTLFGNLMVEGLLSFAPSTILLDTALDGVALKQGYDVNIISYGANLGWAFQADKTRVVPYVSAGVGGASFSPDESAAAFATGGEDVTDLMINFGAGLGIPISETVQLRLDVRDYLVSTNGEFSLFPSDESNSLNTLVLAAGVTVHSR